METKETYFSYSDYNGGTLIVTNVWFKDNLYECTNSVVFCGFDKIYHDWRGSRSTEAGNSPTTPDQADSYYLCFAYHWANLECPDALRQALQNARRPHF